MKDSRYRIRNDRGQTVAPRTASFARAVRLAAELVDKGEATWCVIDEWADGDWKHVGTMK